MLCPALYTYSGAGAVYVQFSHGKIAGWMDEVRKAMHVLCVCLLYIKSPLSPFSLFPLHFRVQYTTKTLFHNSCSINRSQSLPLSLSQAHDTILVLFFCVFSRFLSVSSVHLSNRVVSNRRARTRCRQSSIKAALHLTSPHQNNLISKRCIRIPEPPLYSDTIRKAARGKEYME